MMSSKASLLLVTCVAAAIAGKIPAKQQLSLMEEKNSALSFKIDKAEKQTFKLERTWQGEPVEDPAEILLLQNHQVKETLIHVHWVQDSKAGYQNTSMNIFLSNDQNMTLRVDLEASTAKASFLWGPNGTWGSEAHSLDPKRDNYIGGGFESNFSTNIWEAQVRFPWDFLPPTVMRIQAIHSTSKMNDYRLLFFPNPPPQNLDLADVNNWAQHFDSQCVVDPIYNAVISPIWKGLTVSAVIHTAALVVVVVAVSVSSTAIVGSTFHGDLRKSSVSCCGCCKAETDGDVNVNSDGKCCHSCTCCKAK